MKTKFTPIYRFYQQFYTVSGLDKWSGLSWLNSVFSFLIFSGSVISVEEMQQPTSPDEKKVTLCSSALPFTLNSRVGAPKGHSSVDQTSGGHLDSCCSISSDDVSPTFSVVSYKIHLIRWTVKPQKIVKLSFCLKILKPLLLKEVFIRAVTSTRPIRYWRSAPESLSTN